MTDTDPTDAAWIDNIALQSLFEVLGNDSEEFSELLGDYLEDAPELAVRMVDASGSGDRDAYRIAAHTLKSNARDFGAVRLSKLCANAEAACIASADLDSLATAANQILYAEQASHQTLAQVSLEDLDQSLGKE